MNKEMLGGGVEIRQETRSEKKNFLGTESKCDGKFPK